MSGSGAFVGPHGHDFGEVAKALSSFRGEEIVFFPNPGNAGDNLINLGAYRLMERLGISYTLGNGSSEYPGRVIVHSGGGGLVPMWPGTDAALRRNHRICKALILLPHTVRAYPDLIGEFDERCILFAREAVSYDFLRQHRTKAEVHLGHDMAFILSDAVVREMKWDLRHLARTGLLRPWSRRIAKLLLKSRSGGSHLRSFRRDPESAFAKWPTNTPDLSALFETGDMSPSSCANVAKALRLVMKSYKSIETDRLHLALFSAMLGLNVTMFDNVYGKNRAIYDHSIRDFFDNATFASSNA